MANRTFSAQFTAWQLNLSGQGQHFSTKGVLPCMHLLSLLPVIKCVAATGGLDVDAIPNEISTRIILNSSKSTILAQAINIGAKGVK